MSSLPGGAFVISLDFELMWGVRDKKTTASYGANILGVRNAVPAMLRLFSARGVACTWATVGLLFFDNKRDVRELLPYVRPRYVDERLSPYADVEALGPDEASDPYHYGLSMLRQVAATANQEIGTHTFTHFYCQEEGGTVEAFRADLDAAVAAAKRLGIKLSSIAFPRNQMTPAHLRVCRGVGLRAFRGNEHVWFHRSRPDRGQTLAVRGARLADSYLPLAGAHDHAPTIEEGMVNVPSSRFLRPVRPGGFGESLRLKRITAAMEKAARHGTIFHLWWHPHNFGVNLAENIAFLSTILDHYRRLNDSYGMRSMTMGAVADEVLNAGRGAADK